MSPSQTRFIFCVAIALGVHAVLLGWVSTQDTPRSESLLRATRDADTTDTPPNHSKTLAVRDQRGPDKRSQQMRIGGAPRSQRAASAGANAPTVTRFVMVADQPQAPEATGQQQLSMAVEGRATLVRAGQSMNASSDARAAYLSGWQSEIEARGSRQYPSNLLTGGSSRRLTMAVRLRPDGSLRAIRVLRSSGSDALDRAALQIVRDAAPFRPFDPKLADAAGGLSFAYDWLFERGNGTGLEPAG